MFFPNLINYGKGNILFKIKNQGFTLSLVSLLQVGYHLQGLYTICKRHHNILETVLLLPNLLNYR